MTLDRAGLMDKAMKQTELINYGWLLVPGVAVEGSPLVPGLG